MVKQFIRRKHLLLLIILLPVSIGLIVLFLQHINLFTLNDEINKALDLCLHIVEVIGILAALILTLQELIASKEISRATFIVGLNQSYVDNEEYMRIYNYLQDKYDRANGRGSTDSGSGVPASKEEKIEKGSISNYLTFFETIYILYQRRVISFNVIDDLFAYRFFLAVHSELVQEMKLLYQPENFKNIFKLEREWLDYRADVGKLDRKDLENPPADPKGSVYLTRQLKFMLNDDERYQELLR